MKNIKVAEFRTLDYGEEKGLYERIQVITEEMRCIVDKAKSEKRELTQQEKNKFNSLSYEVKGIEEEKRTLSDKINTELHKNSKSEFRIIDDIILPSEKIEKRTYADKNNNIDFGKLVRGMAGNGWNGASAEQECYRTMSSAGNSVVIPQQLSDYIVDVARAESALFGKIPIAQMDSNNLTIAAQKSDAKASFVKEGDLIPTSETIFEPVTLKGKTLAIFIPIQEQLLDSAKNLSNQLLQSSAKAIALALDKAMLYGTGISDDKEEIKGISIYDNINLDTHDKIDYNAILKGIKSCKKSNIIPTDVVSSTNTGMDLSMLSDSTGQYLTPPSELKKYNISESNNVEDTDIFVYNSNSLLMGLHKNITIEWGVSADMFQRIQKGLRIYLRADLGVINPKGVTKITITN
ncbi:phage major capsid protein [Clostridium cagae]|uniref:phage major capsid protein n=1 Tax=Clostridium cagae TaxID=2080751 RepID=UPI003F775AA6